jgi:hydroxymethylbilane synthase
LKDLPTDLPGGLQFAAVAGARADVRDVLIHHIDTGRFPATGLHPGMSLSDFRPGLTVATGSVRRQTQLLAVRPDFQIVPIRGNVQTRLQKLAMDRKMDATILAAAGLARLGIRISRFGQLRDSGVEHAFAALILEPGLMLPCAGQGAIGLEIRQDDERTAEICRRLNHHDTFQCVTAERSFLHAMGGGCQTPIGAYACVVEERIHLRAVAHLTQNVQRGEATGALADAVAIGEKVAAQLLKAQS